jgi:hypothetical protein
MAYGISWISYKIPKAVFIQPTFIGVSESSTSYSEKAEIASSFTFTGGTFLKSAGWTSNKTLYSHTSSEKANINNFISLSKTEQFEYSLGFTQYSLTTENSIITYSARAGGVDSTYPSTESGVTTLPFQTVTIETTTNSTKSGFLNSTKTSNFALNVFSTSTGIGSTFTIFTTKNENKIVGNQISYTLSILSTTTKQTSSFKTFTNPSGNQLVVFDTIWNRFVSPFDQNTQNVVIGENFNNISETTAINKLDFYSDSAITLFFQPPVSVEETWVREAFTKVLSNGKIETFIENQNYSSTRTIVSTISSSSRVFEITKETFSIEDWITFTSRTITTNLTTSGFQTVTSQSLNSGFTSFEYKIDDDGNESTKIITVIPQNWNATTAIKTTSFVKTIKTTQSFTSQSRNDDLTYTTTTIKIEIDSFFDTISFAGGYDINVSAVPWVTKAGHYTSEAMSLKTESTFFTNTTLSTRYHLTFYSEASTNTPNYGRTEFTNISGTWFKTNNAQLSTQIYNLQEQAFVTHSPNKAIFRAGAHDLQIFTTATRTAGPLFLKASGNDHTLMLSDYEQNLGQEIPGFLIPLIYPTFSTILNKATHGGGLHPSVWSSMTISRHGKNITSIWSFEKSRNNSATDFSTSSGTCELGTESQFPLGAETINWQTLGGAMQPNTNIVAFNVKNVMHITTYNAENSGTQFFTQSNFGFSTLSVGEVITLRREIPIIGGYGIAQFPLLDNGMP